MGPEYETPELKGQREKHPEKFCVNSPWRLGHMHLAREFHLGKILFSTIDRQPQWPGALGTHLGAGRVSLAAAAVAAVAGARLGVWPGNGTRLSGRGRVPAPSPVTRWLPPDTFRPLLCDSV